jgi:FO synthase
MKRVGRFLLDILSPVRDPEILLGLLDPRTPLYELTSAAQESARLGHGSRITFSRKVFIPLTQLCRDRCAYCTFAKAPSRISSAYMKIDEVLNIARHASMVGCHEALFTLGDKPERRYAKAREELAELGFSTTLEYLEYVAKLVMEETGLLPHLNPGLMDEFWMARLKKVSPSQGIMIEQVSRRLLQKGEAHWASPDKDPEKRVAMVVNAGKHNIPFTTGMLFGIGESSEELVQTIVTLAQLSDLPHVQEIIVQNFRAKADTPFANRREPKIGEVLRVIAVMRLAAGPKANIQVPPNLVWNKYELLLDSGINDFGGISPLTLDYVNPEAAWPNIDLLASVCAAKGLQLIERLCVYPEYINTLDKATRWIDSQALRYVLRAADSEGLARQDNWFAGISKEVPCVPQDIHVKAIRKEFEKVLDDAINSTDLDVDKAAFLFSARGVETKLLFEAADMLRQQTNGDIVTYVVNRNINYTNICYFRCQFCAFSKGKLSEDLRGKPYRMGFEEILEYCSQAVERGATEVCLQGGIHPEFTGDFYIELVYRIKERFPNLHIHAFSPLEVFQGAKTSGRTVEQMLLELKKAGLGTLPGTAAEILDDDVRKYICPDKLTTEQWAYVVKTAHYLGIKSTSTIMYGHVDHPINWAKHLILLRDIQMETGGFTEFVPLPFVHLEAPMYRKGLARRGPTFEEAIKMHAVARIVFHGLIDNIQCSWVKLGPDGCKIALKAGCNDMGGVLMSESISRAAGASHGQEFSVDQMHNLITSIDRVPAQRDTYYNIIRSFVRVGS